MLNLLKTRDNTQSVINSITKQRRVLSTLIFLLIWLYANAKNDKGKVVLNPYGFNPLCAVIDFEDTILKDALDCTVTVFGKEEQYNYTYSYQLQKGKKKQIPIIGLYPDFQNNIEVDLLGVTHNYSIETKKLSENLIQDVQVNGDFKNDQLIFTLLISSEMEEAKLNMNYKALGLDGAGDIRWLGDYKGRAHTVIEYIDGYIYAGSKKGPYAGKIVKYNLLGEELEVYDFSKKGKFLNVHHDIRKTNEGSFLITVNRSEYPSIENYVLEYNPNLLGNNVQVQLDLEEFFPSVDDVFVDLPMSFQAGKTDAMHTNGVYPYPDGKHILVSSRNAGLAKIHLPSYELKWMIFPHAVLAAPGDSLFKDELKIKAQLIEQLENYKEDPSKYQRPPACGIIPFQDYTDFKFDYKEFLLRPIDKRDNEIKDIECVFFGQPTDEFSFPFRQHSPIVLDNGNIAMFDNRDKSKFSGASRAVEFEITEDGDGFGGNIKQVWEYKLPSNDYSPIAGDIRELDNGNRWITFGSIGFDLTFKSVDPNKIVLVEVDPITNREKFMMTIQMNARSVAYRSNLVSFSEFQF